MLCGELGVQLDVGDALAVELVLLVFRFHRCGLSRSDTGDRYTEGAARDVLEV